MIRKLLSALLITTSLAGVVAVAVPTPASAACGRLLTFPAWYKGLTVDENSCELKPVGEQADQVPFRTFVTIVIMNIAEMILQLVGYAAVVMLIIGGFKYITSSGDSNNMSSAKKTILNSTIGLVISVFSVAIVNIVSGAFVATSDTSTIGGSDVNVPQVDASDAALQNILNTVYVWAGIIAVVVIVIAGYFFTLSRGDSNQTARARNALIAAAVGLVIILFAFAITQFILGNVV